MKVKVVKKERQFFLLIVREVGQQQEFETDLRHILDAPLPQSHGSRIILFRSLERVVCLSFFRFLFLFR